MATATRRFAVLLIAILLASLTVATWKGRVRLEPPGSPTSATTRAGR